MPRDGSGNYSLPSGQPVVTGTTISSTTHNTLMSDVASALTGSLAKNGEAVATGNQPMGGYKHTNVAVAAALTEYARASQVQDGSICYLTSVAGTNTITATAPLSMAAYTTGQVFRFIPANTTTGATTININGAGAKNIFRYGAAAVGGELRANVPAEIFYDGTQFHIMSAPAVGMVRIAGGTVSAAATLDIGGITTAYRAYILVFDGVAPANDNVEFIMRLSDDAGVSYEADAGDYAWAYAINAESGVGTANGNGSDTEISLTPGWGNQSGEEASGLIMLFNPAGSGVTNVYWLLAQQTQAPAFVAQNGGGQLQAAGATTAFRLLFSSGNIASMNYTFYGLTA